MGRYLAVLGASAVVIGSLYTGYWFAVAHELRAGLEPWAESRRAQGYEVGWRAAEIDGFPFAIRLRLAGVTWRSAQPFPYDARSDDIELDAAPWNLRRWRIKAPQGVVAGIFLDAAGLQAGSVAGTVIDSDADTVLSLSAQGVSGSGTAVGDAASSLDLRLTVPARAPHDDHDPLVSVSVHCADAELPQAPPPFARHIDALSVEVTVRGPIPPAPLAIALAQWRDSGGTLDIEGAHIAWDKSSVDLDGTLALDGAMQPEGALTATIAGGDGIIDAVVAAGGLEPRYAAVAKSVLRAVAEPNNDGGETLHVPLSLQDRRLYVGPAPVAALPHLTWR